MNFAQIKRLLEKFDFKFETNKLPKTIDLKNNNEIYYEIVQDDVDVFRIFKSERNVKKLFKTFNNENETCNEFYLRLFFNYSFNIKQTFLKDFLSQGLDYTKITTFREFENILGKMGIPNIYFNFNSDIKKECFNIVQVEINYRNFYVDQEGNVQIEWKSERISSALSEIFYLYSFKEEQRRLLRLSEINEPFKDELLYAFMTGFNQ